MAEALADRLHLDLRSRATGRERWESCHLVGRVTVASRLQAALGEVRGVRRAAVNPRTGRILLEYTDDGLCHAERLIRDTLCPLLLDDGARKSPETKAAPLTTADGRNPLLEIVRRLPPDRGERLRAPAWSLANNVINFAPELALVGIVNVVNGHTFGALSAIGLTTMRGQVLALGAAAGIAFATELAVERKRRRSWRKIAKKLEHELRSESYAHVQELDMRFVESSSSGELYNMVSENTSKVSKFVEVGADDMLQRAFAAAIIVATLAAVSPSLALATIAPLPVIAIGSRYVQDKTKAVYGEMQQSEESFSRRLANNLSDIGTIKAFTAEEREAARIAGESARLASSSSAAVETSSRYTDVMRVMISTAFALAMVIGGFLVAGKTITPAMFTLLLFFVPKLLVRMEGMGESYDQYQSAVAASRRLLDVFETRPTILSGSTPVDRAAVAGHIRFDSVSFGYSEDKPVLEHFHLDVPERSTIALVGATGSGKSTVMKLLMRFYDVEVGSVSIDGHDLRDLDLRQLRQAIGFVSQDVFLFDGTVYDNIVYGRPDASFEEVVAAAKAAEADGFIRSLADGYGSQVGERGRRLSGGQRQRISIARAILKDPAIFIFDEATSAVDNETELAIQKSIERVGRDRTTILIAHRLSTIRRADRIIVMNDGAIAESGSHDELCAQDGLYAALWRVQTGGALQRANG